MSKLLLFSSRNQSLTAARQCYCISLTAYSICQIDNVAFVAAKKAAAQLLLHILQCAKIIITNSLEMNIYFMIHDLTV